MATTVVARNVWSFTPVRTRSRPFERYSEHQKLPALVCLDLEIPAGARVVSAALHLAEASLIPSLLGIGDRSQDYAPMGVGAAALDDG